MDMPTLRAEAKKYGINSFGMKKEDLETAVIAAKEAAKLGGHPDPVGPPGPIGGLDTSTITEAPVYEKPDYAADDITEDEFIDDENMAENEQEADIESEPAVPLDPSMVAMVAAQKAAEEYVKRFAAMQQAQGQPQGKPSTPDAVIARRHATDASRIMHMPRKDITIEGGMGIGEPQVYYSTVNGHRVAVVPGVKKSIPLAHYENFQRARAQRLKNMRTQKKKAKAAEQEGI